VSIGRVVVIVIRLDRCSSKYGVPPVSTSLVAIFTPTGAKRYPMTVSSLNGANEKCDLTHPRPDSFATFVVPWKTAPLRDTFAATSQLLSCGPGSHFMFGRYVQVLGRTMMSRTVDSCVRQYAPLIRLSKSYSVSFAPSMILSGIVGLLTAPAWDIE
jgi:hypothetical protein